MWADKWKKVDNLVPKILAKALELILNSFSLLTALAWQNAIQERVQKDDTVSLLAWAFIITGMFVLVMFIFEFIKLMFLTELIKVTQRNDTPLHMQSLGKKN